MISGMHWILLLLLLPQPARAESPADPGVTAFTLPNSTIQLLHAMLPVAQKGLLPGGAAIRSLSVRHGDVTVVVARPQGADLAFRLLPRVGPAPDGEPVRITVIAESTDEPSIESIRLALVQLVRDKEGGFQWSGESSAPPPVVLAPSPPLPTPASPAPTVAAEEPVPGAQVALALCLVAFIGWAVLWHRRADARGGGS
jgi:hypothetical protein